MKVDDNLADRLVFVSTPLPTVHKFDDTKSRRDVQRFPEKETKENGSTSASLPKCSYFIQFAKSICTHFRSFYNQASLRFALDQEPSTHALMSEYIKACEDAARAGGKVLQEWLGRFTAREKGPADFVTEADLAAQDAIRRRLLGAFPDHEFLGEEGANFEKPAGPYRWIVDPLDGTTNYVHRFPHYCVSVALEHAGRIIVGAVFDPVLDECFTAAAGQGAYLNGQRLQTSSITRLANALAAASLPAHVTRETPEIADFLAVVLAAQAVRRTGSAALNLAYVAAGRIDANWATSTKIWDIAAAALLVEEAGGVITAPDGGPLRLDCAQFVAAATQPLHDELLGVLKRARSVKDDCA